MKKKGKRGSATSANPPSCKYYGREPPKEFTLQLTTQCNAVFHNKSVALLTTTDSTKVSMKITQAPFFLFFPHIFHLPFNTFYYSIFYYGIVLFVLFFVFFFLFLCVFFVKQSDGLTACVVHLQQHHLVAVVDKQTLDCVLSLFTSISLWFLIRERSRGRKDDRQRSNCWGMRSSRP